jgi:hypothetical protein
VNKLQKGAAERFLAAFLLPSGLAPHSQFLLHGFQGLFGIRDKSAHGIPRVFMVNHFRKELGWDGYNVSTRHGGILDIDCGTDAADDDLG